jgi:spermidine synthase/MFS family permease
MQAPGRAPGGLAYLLFLPLFFASGVAALVYQIVWQRLLTFFSGADVFSVTLIVAAFMAGLGCGNLAGGHLADRLSPRGRVLAFAAAEAGTAAFAIVSVPLIHGFFFVRLGPLALPLSVTTLLLFAVLLLPTFLMGLTLPLLSRVVTTSLGQAGRRIGALYGWNTLGAAVGALGTVWFGVRALGFAGTVHAAAALNLGCALAALTLALRHGVPPEEGASAPQETPAQTVEASPANTLPLAGWLGIYALSGFIALSLEIVWFRLLGILLKSISFTFATLLGVFLCGLGAGALLGSRLAPRGRHPARVFFALQAGIPLYAGLSLALLVWAIGHVALLQWLSSYLAEFDGIDVVEGVRSTLRYLLRLGAVAPHARNTTRQFLLLYLALPALLIGPPTFLMGLSFPFLQRAVQTDVRRVGRRVGWLQSANIVGSTAGSALTGLVLLDVLGTAWTLRLLVALGGLFLLLLARSRDGRLRTGPALACVVLTAAACAVSPSQEWLWARFHGTTPERILFDEDGSGLAVLGEETEDGRPRTVAFSNGIGMGHLPYGSYHTVLGALPALVHPDPESVAVIGLGSGDTLFGIGGRPQTLSVECVEIVSSQAPSLRMLYRKRPDPGLHRVLTDARVQLTSGDGRAFLMRSSARFDVIEADALRRDSAFSGNLYSLEYFQLLRSRLRPGGLGVTWCPTDRVRNTFLRVFPHVLRVGDTLMGSDAPIAFDPAAIRARLREPFTEAYFRRAGVDIGALIEDALVRPVASWGPEFDRSPLQDVNTDLFPRDEYRVSERLLIRSR